VAAIGVAGVVGMVIWSGGDVPSGAVDLDETEFTLAPGPTAPTVSGVATVPGVPTVGAGDPGNDEAGVIAGQALIATFPVPAGGVEQPAEDGRLRSWFIAGKNWQTARDDYLVALAARGMTAELATSIDQRGVVGETYIVSDPATSLTVRLQLAAVSGHFVAWAGV